MIALLPALVVGFIFGWILQKARLTQYSKIVNVFRFTDLTVLKFMLTSIVVGGVGIYLLRDLGIVTLTGTTPTYIVGNLIGGVIFGVGMAWAGF
ncbi:YeeE/YedE thiosulfate transporter family protein [Anaerolineales bacterium HSG24]|nr:YeeE/YedE thiosulfate transporter family protein [Anaerolineales bacterium HSG24]